MTNGHLEPVEIELEMQITPEGAKQFNLFGHDLFGEPVKPGGGLLAQKFELPPFSVLNTQAGYWQDRKRRWLSYGIKSERGRTAKAFTNQAWLSAQATGFSNANLVEADGTSVFDPVLTEMMYRWFCPPGGLILDPFAGGSVRGIVAGLLGYRYRGIDLSGEQIEANIVQRQEICPGADVHWAIGDSATLLPDAAYEVDFILTCPPYGDLEVYSDDPRDLSTMDYPAFIEAYRRIIALAAARLKPDRMACFVVGDFRDKRGMYRGFPADTCIAARDAGLALYNEAILVNVAGSVPIRTSSHFDGSRKLGKMHQNVLVFAKGDPASYWRSLPQTPKPEASKPLPTSIGVGQPGPLGFPRGRGVPGAS